MIIASYNVEAMISNTFYRRSVEHFFPFLRCKQNAISIFLSFFNPRKTKLKHLHALS